MSSNFILTQIVLNNSDEILKSQGFVKNLDDIAVVAKYMQRSFVPRGQLSSETSFKAANKLLWSLKLYLNKKLGYTYRQSPKYKNLFHSYKFMPDLNLYKDVSKYITCEDMPDMSCTYKEVEVASKILLVYSDNIRTEAHLEREARTLFTHTKKVKKVVDTHVTVKMKKKYSTEEERNKDLYKIYLNWLLSKRTAGEIYADIKMEVYISSPFGLIPGKYNKRFLRSYLTFDEFVNMLDKKHEEIPKRFWRIISFVKHLRLGTRQKLSTVAESIISQSLVRGTEGELVPAEDLKVRISKEFIAWYDKIFNHLKDKGYLLESDRYAMVEYNNSKFAYSCYNHYPRSKFIKVVHKVKSVMKNALIRYVVKRYLEDKAEPEVVKEEVKRKIYDQFFVTTMKQNLAKYLEVEDIVKVDKEVLEKNYLNADNSNFAKILFENNAVPVTDFPDLDDKLTPYEVATMAVLMFEEYKKNYKTCEKCRDYTCIKHEKYLPQWRELQRTKFGLQKRAARGRYNATKDEFYHFRFSLEQVEEALGNIE